MYCIILYRYPGVPGYVEMLVLVMLNLLKKLLNLKSLVMLNLLKKLLNLKSLKKKSFGKNNLFSIFINCSFVHTIYQTNHPLLLLGCLSFFGTPAQNTVVFWVGINTIFQGHGLHTTNINKISVLFFASIDAIFPCCKHIATWTGSHEFTKPTFSRWFARRSGFVPSKISTGCTV